MSNIITLYNLICKVYDTTEPPTCTKEQSISPSKYKNVVSISDNDTFFPSSISKDYKFTYIHTYHTTTPIKTIHIPTTTTKPPFTQQQLSTILHYSMTLILTLSQYLNKNPSESIHIVLYLSPLPKQCPTTPITITSNHVNSGSTTHYKIPLIFIYRKEELIKVLLHELIHSCN